MAVAGHEEWVPGQYKQSVPADFREAAIGPKGYKERTKRKLEDMQEDYQQDDEDAIAMDHDGNEEEAAHEQSSKRRKAEGNHYIPVSGRVWKAPAKRAGAIMKPQSKANWEKKMADKASRQNYLDHKRQAVDDAKAKRKAAAEQKKAALARKAANKEKSVVVQKVNTATVKKMMKNKKQRKLLKTADTNPST